MLNLKKGPKMSEDNVYVHVSEEDGCHYREIADILTEMGHVMNHSTVRNYVLRTMKKIAHAYVNKKSISLTEKEISDVAKNPMFQSAVADMLHMIENSRRYSRNDI